MLNATVTEVEAAPPELSRFMVKGEGWQSVAYGNQSFLRGQDVRILVRLEDLRIAPMAGHADATWRGEVVASVFRGARRSLRLRTSAGELHFEVPVLMEMRCGETVEAEPARSSFWGCPQGGTSSAATGTGRRSNAKV